jgi:phosphoribosyl 1,2-cyclic phosphate phosphodiesterase
MGVPVIGCGCAVCRSDDPRNKRFRTSALLEAGGLRLLFDVGPDLRQQALAAGLARIDAVLLTHSHADHVAGIDDLRPLNFAQQSAIPLYGTLPTLAFIRERFAYAFTDGSEGSTRPLIELVEIDGARPFQIGGLAITPFPVPHGTWTITGYRIGGLGYVTDASAVPESARAHLRGLDLLVLNALRERPHPTHLSLAEAVAVAEELRPRRALFVHMNHDLDHAATNAVLPPWAQLAYDGQVVEVAD